MKTTTFLFLAVGAFLVGSCNFSAGTNTDLGTGLSYSYNGFGVERVALADAEGNAMDDNKVASGAKVSLVAIGLSNYVLKDEMASPGLMLLVTDKAGAAMVESADLFADSKGFSATDAASLSASITVGEPFKAGETYHMKMRIWDKNKPENELTAEVDLVIK